MLRLWVWRSSGTASCGRFPRAGMKPALRLSLAGGAAAGSCSCAARAALGGPRPRPRAVRRPRATRASGPTRSRRLLVNLDEEGIRGTLILGASAAREIEAEEAHGALELQWDALVAELPEDWSDLLCRVTLESSDDVPRAALLAAPLNPSRPWGEVGFDFRVARVSGYGTSAQMARRCLVRMDEAGIPGVFEILRALSDTQHVSTQGPVWYVGGKVREHAGLRRAAGRLDRPRGGRGRTRRGRQPGGNDEGGRGRRGARHLPRPRREHSRRRR